MAESTGDTSKKTIDSFADDLDAMLSVEQAAAQQVGSIDDDEAIDRLLVGNVTESTEDDEQDEFDEIDALIAMQQSKQAPITEVEDLSDNIDDIIADMQIDPSYDEFADDEDQLLELAEIDDEPEVDLSALESVGEIDEFGDDQLLEVATEVVIANDLSADMSGLDDAMADTAAEINHQNELVAAEFDISADEFADDNQSQTTDAKVPVQSEPIVETESATEFDVGTELLDVETVVEAEVELDSVPESDSISQTEPAEIATNPLVDALPESVVPASVVVAEPVTERQADYSAALAAIAAQLKDLKKHQSQIKQDIELKTSKEELSQCVDSVESLQTEQKKTKRNLDAVANKKPIAAYVASGLAVTALLIGTGLGFQGFVAKTQVGELVEIIQKLQQQVNAAPSADAADKELLRKQMDELSIANSVNATQIAELTKTVHGEGGADAKITGEVAKQLTDLNNQNMQMGAALEALQNQIASLEKNRAVGVAPKAVAPKKPVVIEENWAVNLVAFKQDWYAQRKADEFAGKGIPAKVSKTESKGENWYRLSVDGFKTQYEAAGYAAKVKKTLNLDSVWVTKNKE